MSHSESDEIDESRVVPVGTAANEIVADLWRQVLEDEGIIVALKPTGAGPSFGTNALNPHVVLVRDDQAERARAIIAELEEEEASEL